VIVLVLGGARSGKSDVAERIARERSGAVTYLATASVDSTDADFVARVDRHRARRDPAWVTVECGRDLVSALRAADELALVDSLGTWIADHPDFSVDVDGLIGAIADRDGDTVVVSEEVGLSVHPEHAAGRAFRDALGDANRAVAAIADEVLLVVAGRVLALP
jgi:adenosyl cobinamide kinase/adenosyl cobinamide phosphate guanylyltransferase